MTYYADLSAYEYGAHSDEDRSCLNIGWLSPDYAYPTRPPTQRFVDALIWCSMRPVRLCRGYHVCELGCRAPRIFEMPTMSYQGRKVHLGNGEVRVTGPDGIHYAAPTLIAHYVAVHSYAPPESFMQGVVRRVQEIHVLPLGGVERLRGMTISERFNVCLDALEALQAQKPDDWLAEAISAIHALAPRLDASSSAAFETEGERLWEILYAVEREDPIGEAACSLGAFFEALNMGGPEGDEATVEQSIVVIERCHDAGLVQWRAELTPSCWDEAS